jgi:hypothetical protein
MIPPVECGHESICADQFPYRTICTNQMRLASLRVAIEPAHDGLDHAVHSLEAQLRGHRYTPPDQRLNAVQFDTQDGDGVVGHGGKSL